MPSEGAGGRKAVARREVQEWALQSSQSHQLPWASKAEALASWLTQLSTVSFEGISTACQTI